MEDLNNVKDQYEEQIQAELTKISSCLGQMAGNSNYLAYFAYLANLESIFSKVYFLLFELKLEGKNMSLNVSNIISQVDAVYNAALIDNLIYTRWSTFLHNLSYFNSISKEDWNERSLFYTKCQIERNNPQKVIFKAHHPGLPNSGGKCYANAMLKIFSNNTCLYDYFLKTKYSTNNFNNNPSEYETYTVLLGQNQTITMTATRSNKEFTREFINLLSAIDRNGNVDMQAKNFYDTLEEANPLFKGWAGDSKDLFLYLLHTVHAVISKTVPGVVAIKQQQQQQQPNQHDCKDMFNWFLTRPDQQEQSIISNTFHGVRESCTQCLECRKKYGGKTQCPTVYNFQKNEFFSFALYEAKEYIKKRYKNSGKPVPSDPVISLRDCFESDTSIQLLTKYYIEDEDKEMDNRFYCSVCHKPQDSEIRTQIYSLPNDVIINLDRGKDNKFPLRVDLPFYLDCHDTGVIQKTQQYEFKFLTGINQLIGRSGDFAHFVACTKSSKDGKWYRHSDDTVEQVSEQKIKEIKHPDTIKQNLTVCNVVYSGKDTHMSIAQKMLFYVLENVNGEDNRRAIINRFDYLNEIPNVGDELAKKLAYLLMYAHANRDNIPNDKLSNLVCAVYEIIEGDSKFSDNSMEHYRNIIQQAAMQISQNQNIVSIQNIKDWIVEEYCFSKITDSNYRAAIKQWLQNSGPNKGKFLHLLMYIGVNSGSIQSDNLSNLICAIYDMVKNDKDLSGSYMECYKFLIQEAAIRISRENSTVTVENIITWIIDKHCLRKVMDQNYKTAISQWLRNSGSNRGRFSHLLVYAATRNTTHRNILSNLICAVFDMIRTDNLLDDNKFNVNYGGNFTSVTRMQHYRNIIDATAQQAWNVSNMYPWLYRRGNVQLPRSLTNVAVHNKYSNKGYSDQQLLSQMNMNNPYSVDDFVSYLNSNFTRVNNQSMNIQVSRGQIVNVNIQNVQGSNMVRQNNQNNNLNNAIQNNQTNNINSRQNNNTKQIEKEGKNTVVNKKIPEIKASAQIESINDGNQNIQRDIVNTSEQNMAQSKSNSSDSHQENKDIKDVKESNNLNTIVDNNSQTDNLGNENGLNQSKNVVSRSKEGLEIRNKLGKNSEDENKIENKTEDSKIENENDQKDMNMTQPNDLKTETEAEKKETESTKEEKKIKDTKKVIESNTKKEEADNKITYTNDRIFEEIENAYRQDREINSDILSDKLGDAIKSSERYYYYATMLSSEKYREIKKNFSPWMRFIIFFYWLIPFKLFTHPDKITINKQSISNGNKNKIFPPHQNIIEEGATQDKTNDKIFDNSL